MSRDIRLMSFNPSWQQEFEQNKSSLFQATEGWIADCRHVGGTALEDNLAQPVIDILAGLPAMDGLNAACELVEGLNYRRLPAPSWCDTELVAYLEKPRLGDVTHTVLLTRLNGRVWNQTLAIQKQLACDLADRQRLQNLKRDHFSSGCGAQARYVAAKNEFFIQLLQQITE